MKFSLDFAHGEEQIMRISGDTEQLGLWNKGSGPINLKEGNHSTSYSQVDAPKKVVYKYSYKNEQTN